MKSATAYARRTADFRAALVAAIQPWQLIRIFRRIAQRAERGDLQCAKWIADRLAGRVPWQIRMTEDVNPYDPTMNFIDGEHPAFAFDEKAPGVALTAL